MFVVELGVVMAKSVLWLTKKKFGRRLVVVD